MPERIYYVICEDNCKFEGMTKEQIYAAIAEATGHTPTPVDEAFITMIKEQNANHNIKVWKGTAAQYNALETKENDTLYFIDTNTVKDVTDLENAINGLEQDLETLQNRTQPINKGGTGATTAATARTNLGLSGAQTRTLLWTNSSPDSEFSAQSVYVSLSSYDWVEVVFQAGLGWYVHFIEKAKYKSGNGIMALNPDSEHVMQRGGTLYSNRIQFDNCVEASTTLNRFLIPLYIYGIKEV